MTRIYTQPSNTACEYTPGAEQDAMLAIAAAAGVKVLRVKAGPYWPAQWRYGVNGGVAGVAATAGDREAHYLALDAFVAKCRAAGIGVIFTLFFRLATVADLAGQTVRAGWLNAGATRTYAQAFTQELMTRYLNEAAVYGYEFSNEVNHYNDCVDANMGGYPGVNVSAGTAASYSAANTIFNGTELASVLSWWYGVASAVDSQRIMLTGNGPNSYSQPGGAAGISTPMRAWHLEQVRDNPTNCGSIHWYGNVGYGSANFRGLNAVLTGARHWQRAQGRGFLVGEFGNQPWGITAISSSGGTATVTCSPSCPVEVGDQVQIDGTGSVFDGETLTLTTVNAARTSLTAPCTITASWSGSATGLQHMSAAKLERMCDDIIESDVDVALCWCLDGDEATPAWQSITYPGNEAQQTVLRAANARLGW